MLAEKIKKTVQEGESCELHNPPFAAKKISPSPYHAFWNHPLLIEILFWKLDKQKTVFVSAHPLPLFCQKLPQTENGITQPPKKVDRSTRLHMKYKWHLTCIFLLKGIFENGITQPPKQVDRSTRLHMKYKWHLTCLFLLKGIFYVKSGLSAGGCRSLGEMASFKCHSKIFFMDKT